MQSLQAAGLDFVLAKHENSAGFMAEGVHHQNGAPAVLLATVGPGVANAVNVVANAQQDRVPLIFLTGCVDADEAATYTHQVFDHGAVLRPVVKASFTMVPGAADVLIDKAVALALADPPGPVHIDVPVRVAATEEPEAAPVRQARPAPSVPAPGPQLDQARTWLAEARRPVVIAGVEVLQHGAETAVADFVERFQAPLVTTYKAKGVLDERHPLAVGGMGLSPIADRQVLPLLAEADLIVLAGYDPIEMRTGWRNPWPAGARVVELTSQANTHYMHTSPICFVGDIGAGLSAMADGVAPARSDWPQDRVSLIRTALRAAYRVEEPWGPAAVVETVRRLVPEDAIATCDSGAHRILLSQTWACHQPRGLLQSTGLCTMGCALPLAMGAKLADPHRAVIAFTGDAGLEMVMGELATLRDLKLPVVVVVFVDEQLALIELKQRAMQLPSVGIAFGGTDFAALAEALGGEGHNVANRPELEAALSTALASDRFSILACRIGPRSYDGRI